MDKDRLALAENKNAQNEKELESTREELRTLRTEHMKFARENADFKEQLRILNENLKRESQLAHSKESENLTLQHESKVLRDMLDQMRSTGETHKSDQERLIDNLKMQLEQTREMLTEFKGNKEREVRKVKERFEEERRKESERYEGEYEKLKHEIELMQRKLG